MGVLRDRMAVDLGLRGLSPVTQRIYLRCAERFAAYHRRPTMTEATKQLVPEGILELIVNMMMAIHRPLEPDDLTGTAVWLASDDAKMVTGQCILVDGGMIMLG